MKIRLLVSAFLAIALFSCKETTFNVNVELQNAEGKKVFMQKKVNNETIVIDSAIIQNNMVNFIVEEGNPATHYSIRIESVRYPISFFSENNDIKVVGDLKDSRNIIANGSNAQQVINEFNNENKKFNNQFNELHQQYKVAAQNNDQSAIEKIDNEYGMIEINQ